MKTTNNLRRYAIHESGHVLFAWLNAGRLISVSISADGLNNTTIINHPVFKILHKISHKHPLMKQWISGLLAGPAAEMHSDNLLWGKLPLVLQGDIQVAMKTMKSRGWVPPSNYTCNNFFHVFGSQARVFTVGRWREISLLADVLERRLELSGMECAKFIEEIWQPEPLPKGILRFWNHKN